MQAVVATSGIVAPVVVTGGEVMKSLPPEALEQVAAYFQALAEPTRLQLLNLLRDGARNVGELALLCGSSAANVSRHMALLTSHGLVSREARGNSVYYRIASDSVFALCDLVCGQIAEQHEKAARDGAAFRLGAPASKRPD